MRSNRLHWKSWLLAVAGVFVLARPATGADKPLSVHCVNGLWHGYYRLDEAFARLGVNRVSESWHVSKWGFGSPGNWESPFSSAVDAFPESTNDLTRNDLVIVCNINGNALAQRGAASQLKAYAQQGGVVLFLGGRYAFGKEYHLSPLEDMAPVVFGERFDLQHETNGLALKPSDDAPESIKKLAWNQTPRIYWYHQLQPKAGAKILLEAGGKPILVTAPFGQGAVGVFAGTVMGDPPPGQVSFWEWKDWACLLATLLDTEVRQATGKANATTGAAADKTASRLAEAAMGGAALGDSLQPLLLFCSRPVVLAKLLDAIASSEKDINEASVDQIADASFPWLGPSNGGQARALLASGQINKGCLGLRILGGSRSDTALETIRRAWLSGTLKKSNDDLMDETGELMNEKLIRETALVALGDLGADDALKVLKAAAGAFAKGAYPIGANQAAISLDNRNYQKAMLSMLRCGDETAAGPVVDFLMENIYIIARSRTWETSIPGYLTEARRQLPATQAWQENLLAKLPLVPDKMLPALARRVAAEKDGYVMPIALRCFGGRLLDDSVRSILATSPLPAVAALGEAGPHILSVSHRQ